MPGVDAQPAVSTPRRSALSLRSAANDGRRAAGLAASCFATNVEALAVARQQNEVVAAPGEAIGIAAPMLRTRRDKAVPLRWKRSCQSSFRV